MTATEVAKQLIQELTEAAKPWEQILGVLPTANISATARRFATQPTRANAEALLRVLPEARTPKWWATPLGQTVGRTIGAGDRRMTYAQAAAWLGVTTNTIGGMVSRGTLTGSNGEGLLAAEVVAYGDNRKHPNRNNR